MNLLQLNIFRGSIFKQLKFLLSSPQKAQTSFYISEAGTVSKEVIPMHTGFMCPPMIKKAWVVIHSLKFQIYKKGIPIQGDAVLLISDRSYIPLDPNVTMKPKDRERLTSLKDIARLRHAEARADVGTGQDDSTDTPQTVIYICGALIGLTLIIFLILRGCGGGA